MARDETLRFFGLCSLDIDAIRADVGERVRFVYQPDSKDALFGHAHVVVPRCDETVQTILLRHAEVLRPPEGPEIE